MPLTMRVLVLGGGDVGSAVAHLLTGCGLAVLICDRAHSPHARRGMAFTDALFDGDATLDGVTAHYLPDTTGVEDCWRRKVIPIVTLPEAELLATLEFAAVVDATMRRNRVPPDLRTQAPCTVGLGPGYSPGVNCHMAIETQWGSAMGSVLRDRPAADRSGGPRALDGVTRERFASAPASGTWHTQALLGQAVRAGDPLGDLEGQIVHAPISGTLRGLARDGVVVPSGQRVLEVDPRTEPQVYGLGERPLAIASGVAEALGVLPEASVPR